MITCNLRPTSETVLLDRKAELSVAAGIAGVWADFMRWLLTTVKTEYVITGDKLDPKGTYLILANHQSWIDIMMVMVVLGKGTTLPRFFMKWELVYMPVINICAWALDFPIMRRYTQEDIKDRPELKNRDFDYAHEVLSRNPDQACVVVNYAEGTRFTPEKHKKNRHRISIYLNQSRRTTATLNCLRNRLTDHRHHAGIPRSQTGCVATVSGQVPES